MKFLVIILTICINVAFLFATIVEAQPQPPQPHDWHVTLRVLDEEGKPVSAAIAEVTYPAERILKNGFKKTGLTDSNGFFFATSTIWSAQTLGFLVQKDGFYANSSFYVLGGYDSNKWSPTITLILKKAIPFKRLLSFDGTNGAMPLSGLTIGEDGNLYGTTCRGGMFNKGAIYKLTTNGVLTAIFSFDGTNGWSPECELVQGHDGRLYGVCFIAGVFSIATDGTGFKSLHHFSNEQTPTHGLTLGADKNLYGYMPFGGTGNNGAIFEITPDGQFQIVVSCDNHTGAFCDGLTLGRDGNLYGTMAFGGEYYTGNFFRLSTNGVFTILASFNETNNPRVFRNNLVQGLDGDFYGTTEFGGNHDIEFEDGENTVGDGTFFKVSTNGSAITLASFDGQNGAHPRAKLIQTSDGNFYGVTVNGLGSQGTIFRATANGKITPIFPFVGLNYEDALTNGGWPCGLVRLPNGDFYGVTIYGGKDAHMAGYGSGTVFRFRIDNM